MPFHIISHTCLFEWKDAILFCKLVTNLQIYLSTGLKYGSIIIKVLSILKPTILLPRSVQQLLT